MPKIKHIGTSRYRERIKYSLTEKILAEEWEAENTQPEPFSGLERIMCYLDGKDFKLTQRDATVAATVIQWLGTAVGQGFLYEVNRRIKRTKELAELYGKICPICGSKKVCRSVMWTHENKIKRCNNCYWCWTYKYDKPQPKQKSQKKPIRDLTL